MRRSRHLEPLASTDIKSKLTVEKPCPDFIGITQLFQETTVFRHALDTECLVLTPNSVNKVIKGDRNGASVAADISGVC